MNFGGTATFVFIAVISSLIHKFLLSAISNGAFLSKQFNFWRDFMDEKKLIKKMREKGSF